MNRIRRLIAGLLNFVVLSVLFLGSCAGPIALYSHSPWWLIEEIKPGEAPGSFYVAFMSEDSKGSRELHVARHKFDPGKAGHSNVQYRMPEERLSYSFGAGEGSASIHARNEAQGSQLVQVFVVGDTPWTSLSEYRVVDNKVHPLRHAHSAAWLLLGIVALLLLLNPLLKPIRRGINRLLRIEAP